MFYFRHSGHQDRLRHSAKSALEMSKRLCVTAGLTGPASTAPTRPSWCRAPGHRRSGQRRPARSTTPSAPPRIGRQRRGSTTTRSWRETSKVDFQFQTHSDCEVLLALYKEKAPPFLDDLNGIFAFILYDAEQDAYLIGRDHMGIIPSTPAATSTATSTSPPGDEGPGAGVQERRDLPAVGHYLWSKDGELKTWYKRDWMEYAAVEHNVSDKAELKAALEAAVKRQLMCDVPYGVLLSGGLDSSVIISAITKALCRPPSRDDDKSEAWWPQLHSSPSA